ncbi:MAG: hypothetical protein AB7G15_11900 [Alphaproteobacteria bacterium]
MSLITVGLLILIHKLGPDQATAALVGAALAQNLRVTGVPKGTKAH